MNNPAKRSQFEFIALMAMTMSLAALTIDTILPALSEIGEAIHVQDPTDVQLFITMIFLGLGLGQLVFGPLSDSFGRKPMVILGVVVYFIASLICVFAPNLEWMVAGRVLQGIGLAGPRTVSLSIVRDEYKGDLMAKIMSFVSIVFIIVPIIAPALGKFIMYYYDWQAIFYFQLIFAFIITVWFMLRQPETLKPEHKVPFSKALFINGFKELIKYKSTLVFMVIAGFITGAFMVYLSASEHIFEVQYGLEEEFIYIFAGLALTLGLSTFLNGFLVMKLGMRRLSYIALIGFCIIAGLYSILYYGDENPSIYVLMTFLAVQFFSIGFIFGNLKSIMMEPIGHIAGVGAAITGAFSTMMAVPLGTYIGSFIDTTVWPLFFGFLVCGLLSLAIFMWLNHYENKQI